PHAHNTAGKDTRPPSVATTTGGATPNAAMRPSAAKPNRSSPWNDTEPNANSALVQNRKLAATNSGASPASYSKRRAACRGANSATRPITANTGADSSNAARI